MAHRGAAGGAGATRLDAWLGTGARAANGRPEQGTKAQIPQTHWFCVFVLGEAQKSPLRLHLQHLPSVLVAIPGIWECVGAVGPGSEHLIPVLVDSFQPLHLHMCLKLFSDVYNGAIMVFISLPLLIQSSA